MPSDSQQGRHHARRAGPFNIVSGGSVLGVSVIGFTLAVLFSLEAGAQQSRTVRDGVYTAEQAARGQKIYAVRCSYCHGETLGGNAGPALTGNGFLAVWNKQPVADLVNKIHATMPADAAGELTRQQATDIVAFILQFGRFPAGQTELAADEAALKQIALTALDASSSGQPIAPPAGQAPSFPAVGNLAQVMRGILFPSSNLIFDVQIRDPGAPMTPSAAASSTDATLTVRFGGIYAGWQLVDYAAIAVAESAPLMLTPGRRCENGKPVPVERADWIKYTQELAEAGKAAYKASQSRNQEAVSDASNQIADACLNCHVAYRDKPGGLAAHCVP
jgi:mono/diheme cytochrome c family protein